jgi:hypothetical protein
MPHGAATAVPLTMATSAAPITVWNAVTRFINVLTLFDKTLLAAAASWTQHRARMLSVQYVLLLHSF